MSEQQFETISAADLVHEPDIESLSLLVNIASSTYTQLEASPRAYPALPRPVAYWRLVDSFLHYCTLR